VDSCPVVIYTLRFYENILEIFIATLCIRKQRELRVNMWILSALHDTLLEIKDTYLYIFNYVPCQFTLQTNAKCCCLITSSSEDRCENWRQFEH